MKAWMEKWITLASAIFILCGCVTAPEKPQQMKSDDYSYAQDYLSWLAYKEMKKAEVTGLSIALVNDQRVIWSTGFGFADLRKKIPATSQTVYRVGSISKLFTVASAMQLVEKGEIDLDYPLKAYLPEFSVKSRFPNATPITLRHLMTHHSGLPSDLWKGMWTQNPLPISSEISQLRDEFLATPPNYVFSYSNLGMSLVGHVVEERVGRDFSEYLLESLLSPLGMTQSAFSTTVDKSSKASKAYRKGKELEESPLRSLPAGGLNSTVLDLARFMQMILADGRIGQKQLLQPHNVAEMLRPQNTETPLDLNFKIGLGWMLGGLGDIDIRGAGPVAHHAGATLYHRSQLILLPEQKLGVVVLSNSATAGPVVNSLASKAIKLALEVKSGIKQPERVALKGRDYSLPQELQQKWEGYYATVAGLIKIENHSDYLEANVMGKPLRLVSRSDGLLGLQYRLLGVIPISLGELDQIGFTRTTVEGREIIKANSRGQELLVGERIKPVPIQEEWEVRTGTYEIINLGADTVMFKDLRLRQENGLLLMDYTMPLFFKGEKSFALSPLSNTEAIICGLGRGMGETIQVVTIDGEELLHYSGYLLRKVEQ